MKDKRDKIVLVGAGVGGRAILLTLMKIPDIRIKYVCDIDHDAPGLILARRNGIECCMEEWPERIASDKDIDLIFEVTGLAEVFAELNRIKPRNCILIAASGTRIIFNILDRQFRIAQELRRYKRSLEHRIEDRTREIRKANKELEKRVIEYGKLNEKLQEINNQKTKYLLQAAHQLKAPFAAIQSYADIIIEGYTGDIPQQTHDIMEKIKTRCDHLAISIKDMLALANLKSFVKENMRVRPVNLDNLIADLIARHRVIARGRNISIIPPPRKNYFINGNREQMLILFSTLLENAINYSKDGVDVCLKIVKKGSNTVAISVIDRGIGISDVNLTKIFREYFRSDNAVAQHENGTGLGLAIASEIAKLHGFTIHVESELEKGSTFTVTAKLYTKKP